ncbi:sigma-E factor regulatory protein RseB [Xenorhabdus innexi]|uniref:Sigma factor algU regulatory protein MucB n=1 Tax=Xenorhabdus innexi TaxID=290109 RepID=A0A1N6MVD1_9GAMM|nr:sigma-E factor regulatory protein RseB [Xenorhabdus innexi]PHM38244.1 sigma factor algU regulatory protein MucB [Xenorhabdus innexi]SIP72781.1 Sigma-E factor regulatory protein rseB [Xenorhabdus innexi]
MKYTFFFILLFGSFLNSSKASGQQNSTEALLQGMGHSVQTLSYELAFINLNKQFLIPLRYRHAIIDNQPIAQLIQMDNTRREIIQRGDQISYYESGLDSFSLRGDRIVDYLPPIIFADFSQLQKFYNFIDAGSTHVGDHPVYFVRIISKDNDRYNYNLLIDKKSYLPLLIELFDQDEMKVVEQFRVISSRVNDDIKQELNAIVHLKLPPMLVIPKAEKVKFNWKVSKLPEGFREVSRNRSRLSKTELLESIMYSDGVFNFSVNVINTGEKTAGEPLYRQGRRTVYTVSHGRHSISVIGELPFATIKQIVGSVTFTGDN